MFRLTNLQPFYAPADTETGGAIEKDEVKNLEQTIFEGLDDEVDDETLELPKKEAARKRDTEVSLEAGEGESEEDAEATLEDQIEEDLNSPPEAKLALMEPVRRAEILKYDPNLFKKFPYLEHAYYRDRAYTEIYPTPADAKEASEKAEALDNFQEALNGGDIGKVFSAVRQEDQQAFYKLVDNLMIDLGKVDENAQVHVIGNIGKHLVSQMLAEAQSGWHEALKHAAIILNQFLTGSSELARPTKLAREEQKNPEVDQQRQQWIAEKFDSTRTDMITRLDGKITATLNKRLDPNESMTPFVRKAAVADAKREVQALISKDTRFQSVMKAAWSRAAKSNYSKADAEYILKMYENKAANLLPTVIAKVRSEALKGSGKRSLNSSESEDEIEVRAPTKRGPVAPGRSASPSNSGSGNARERAKQVFGGKNAPSTKDFLMQD